MKLSPTKGVMYFGKKEKLSSRYIRPFEVIKRIGSIDYKLFFPPSMFGVHLVFLYVYVKEMLWRWGLLYLLELRVI